MMNDVDLSTPEGREEMAEAEIALTQQADYQPELELLGSLIPEAGVMVVGDVAYPLFFDFWALRDIEQLLETTVFSIDIDESKMNSTHFLKMLEFGIQGGVRRQWRLYNPGDRQPTLKVEDITPESIANLVDAYSDFVGNTVSAISMMWVAVKLAWSRSVSPPSPPVPGMEEVSETNPTQDAQLGDQ